MARKSDNKKECPELVRVFSRRLGDVICSDGSILKFEQVTQVSKEISDWLMKTFGDLMLKVD
jgi:uncharacterized hydantoinase/oxoprolinase family protein